MGLGGKSGVYGALTVTQHSSQHYISSKFQNVNTILKKLTAFYMSTRPSNKGKLSYILAHQPKSFDWRLRDVKPHPWKKVPEEVLLLVGEILNQIIAICE